MKFKMKMYVICMIFLALFCVAAVSANENATDEIALDNSDELAVDEIATDNSNKLTADENSDEILAVEDNAEKLTATAKPVKAKIYAKSFTTHFDSTKSLKVQVKDKAGKPLRDVYVKVKFSKSTHYGYTNSKGNYYTLVPETAGNHKATISLDDRGYTAKAIRINVKITKAPVKIAAKRIKTDSASKFKLMAVVKDKYGYLIDAGFVKFKINGKTYKVKVNNGVAVKKLKIKNAKTYTYKATFSSKNYKTKSASSKVTVKKVYVLKKAGIAFKISKSQYNAIQYVKNHKYASHLSKNANFYVKTKYYYYGLPVYAIVTTWSGIQNGHYYNYPQVQFVSVYGGYIEDYITGHYKI